MELDSQPVVLELRSVAEGPRILSPRENALTEQLVCVLVANGESTKAIAKKLDLPDSYIDRVCASPRGQDMVVRFQIDVCPDPRSRIKKLAELAVNVQTKLLVDPKTPVAVLAKVSQDVIDRAHGKATQVIESHNLNFDVKDAVQLEKALQASQDKLKRIEDMRKKLSIPVHAEQAQRAVTISSPLVPFEQLAKTG